MDGEQNGSQEATQGGAQEQAQQGQQQEPQGSKEVTGNNAGAATDSGKQLRHFREVAGLSDDTDTKTKKE